MKQAAAANFVDGWSQQPDSQRMKLARASDDEVRVKSLYQHWLEGTEPPECTGAVNLALIATTPQQLEEMAEAKANRDGYGGAPPTEGNRHGVGPSIAPEQPRAAGDGRPSPEKEAPPGPVNEPAPPSRTFNRAAPLLAPEQPVQINFPSSPAAQEQEAPAGSTRQS